MRKPPSDAAPAVKPGPWRRRLQHPWLPALLGLLCFVSSLGNGYAYDDRALVLDNPRVRSLTAWRDIWLADWWYSTRVDSPAYARRDRLYRPLTLFSFALNHAVHGLPPLGFHLVNVLLHAGVCVAVWHFARRLTGDAAAASVAATLFAVHPVHVEAVANVVGRAELLAALFLLLGLLALCPGAGRPRPGHALLAGLAFLAALLSKETAVCYPAIALLVLSAVHRAQRLSRRQWLLSAACLLLPLTVYFPLRYAALGGHLFRARPAELMNPLVLATGGQRVLGALTVLGHYTRLLVVPQQLSPDYGLAIIDPARGFTGMALLGLLAAGALALGLLGIARPNPTWRRVGLLTAVFVASYALISNTLLLIGVSLAERLMYWPSVPVLVLAGLGSIEFWRRQCAPGRRLAASAHLLRVLGGLLVVALGLRTVVRNGDWACNMTLFSEGVATAPRGAHLQKCCAGELLQLWRVAKRQADLSPYDDRDALQRAAERHMRGLGMWDDAWPVERKWEALLLAAQQHLSAAIEILPPYGDALALRGRVRAQLGQTELARRDVEAALRVMPGNQEARETLALLNYGPDADQQIAAVQEQTTTRPDDVALRLELGRKLLEHGRLGPAQEQFERAVSLDGHNAAAWRGLGEVLALKQQDERAIAAFERVLTLDPDDWEAHANLWQLLAQRDPAAAREHARRAYELQPNDVRTVVNYAEACVASGQMDQALTLYRRAERGLDPDDPFWRVVHERIAHLAGKPR